MGRPPIYDNADDLQQKIEEYFSGGYNLRSIISNGIELKVPAITISGLAYYLGFESRQSFYDYEERGVFSYIIKRARLRIEANYEENLQMGTPSGSIFALKNMGWSDKQEVEHSGTQTMVSVTVDSDKTGEELKRLIGDGGKTD